MSPEQLARLLTSLEKAAEVVEAIDNRDIQARRAWDLSGWSYELIPWGVRFICRRYNRSQPTEILAVIGRPDSGGLMQRGNQAESSVPASVLLFV